MTFISHISTVIVPSSVVSSLVVVIDCTTTMWFTHLLIERGASFHVFFKAQCSPRHIVEAPLYVYEESIARPPAPNCVSTSDIAGLSVSVDGLGW